MENFGDWLTRELIEREMSQASLARKAQISPTQVANVLNGFRKPGDKFCRAIARAFGIPPEEVMRHAGILPPTKPRTERAARLLAIMAELPDDEVEFLEQFARLRLDYQRRKGRRREQAPEAAKVT